MSLTALNLFSFYYNFTTTFAPAFAISIFETGTCNKLGLVSFPRLKYFQRNVDEPEDPNFFENGAKDSGDFVTYVESKIDEAEREHLGVIGDANGKSSEGVAREWKHCS